MPSIPPIDAKDDRLHQELAQDVPPAGAQCLASPISRVRSVTLTSMTFIPPDAPADQAHASDQAEQDREDVGGEGGGGEQAPAVWTREVVRLARGPSAASRSISVTASVPPRRSGRGIFTESEIDPLTLSRPKSPSGGRERGRGRCRRGRRTRPTFPFGSSTPITRSRRFTGPLSCT